MSFLKKNRNKVIGLVVVGALIAIPIAWWLISPLFITNQVDEAFPFDVPTAAEVAEMPALEAREALESVVDEAMDAMKDGEISAEQETALQEQVEAAAAGMSDIEMEEEMPESAEWIASANGSFVGADDFHQGSGTATIFTQGGQSILRLEDFDVTNGPDLHVLLVENIDGTSSDELGEYVDLGSLKGNVGNQNYEIPADIDLSKYSGVMIYCMPFHVVFSTAAFQ